MSLLLDTPKSSSTENPIIDSKKSMTFGDLYTRIQSESILTPEQEVALKEKITAKYGHKLLSKRKELVTESTRGELEELLADMPGKSDILSKLEGILPGKSKVTEVAKGATEDATKMAKEGIEKAKNLTPENMKAAVSKLGDTFSTGTTVLATAGAAVMAAPTIEGKAKALDGVMRVVGEYWDMAGNFLNTILAAFAAFFSGKFSEGIDKLKGAFGMGEKKDPKTLAEDAKKKGEKGIEAVKSQGEKAVETILDPKKTKELIGNLSQGLADKISTKYFGGQKLSSAQMEKIDAILTNSLDPESLQKIAKRYQKDGLAINVGELWDAIWEVGGAFPARVMWELSWSGIIPKWAITQHVVINPAKNMIALTFDGLGFPVSKISLSDWNSMLDEKAKKGDTHALDMARIQLYGINSVLWRTMGYVLGTAVAAGIMITDTTTKTDGLKMGKMTTLKEYDMLAGEFQKIESTLSRGIATEQSGGLFKQMMEGIKGVHANSLLLDTIAKNSPKGVMDATKIIDAISKNPELAVFHKEMDSLKGLTDPKSADVFRDAVKKMAFQQSSTANWSQDLVREWSKYAGGQNSAMTNYLSRIDQVKASQIELLGNSGLSEKWNRMKLSWNSLKMARSGDTVNLHLETAEDISKFRSFLSVIPGGIKAIAEIIPAASLVVSLGSVVFASKDEKDSIGESLMDVFKTALIPAYGTFGIIKSKTVDFGKMLERHEMPEFSDIALTGVIGGVFMYEVTRVASGLVDMKNGNIVKGLSKLTYMHDIGRGLGQISRGFQNISALAKTLVANPAVTKALTDLATKVPKKGRLAIGAVALLAAGGAYAYVSGPENPEDIMKSLYKEGWLDIGNNPTPKMKEAFQSKNQTERKDILDELLIMHLETNKNLPKTHYEGESGKYSIITGTTFTGQKLIDSLFRSTIQSLGVDIDLQKA